MITDSDTSATIERMAHLQAAQGYLYCLSHENLLNRDLINKIAINILLGIAIVPSMTLSSTIVPIALSIMTLRLLAYNITYLFLRYQYQQEANRWKPTFESVLAGNYEAAFNQLKINVEYINDHFFFDLSKVDTKGDARMELYERLYRYNEKFQIVSLSTNKQFFQDLQYLLGILKEFELQNSEDYKSLNSYTDIERFAAYRYVDPLIAINILRNSKGQFCAQRVDDFAQFLFNDVIRILKYDYAPTLYDNNKSLLSISDDKKLYLELLKTYGESLTSKQIRALEEMLPCQTMGQLYLIAREVRT